MWFKEVGYSDVFWTQFRTKVFLGAVFGLAFAGMLLASLFTVQKVTSPHRLFSMEDSAIERYRASLKPYVRLAVVGVSLLFGLFAGSGATSQWRSWLLYRNGVTFGETDPLFGKDLGFYVFDLPFLRFVFTWTFSTLLVLTIVTAAAHYFMGGIRLDQRGARATPQVKAHISVLLGLIVLLKAWGYRLDQYGLLFSPRGTVTGASYTDVNAQKPALTLLIIVAIVVAVLFFVNTRVRGWTIPVAGIGLLMLTSLVVGGAYPALVQRIRVTPVERIREKPYIQRNITATRGAFGIDKVATKPFSGETRVDQAMLRRNAQTVENIRLWAPDILEDVYGQLQRIRQYYDFLDVDVDRYTIGGRRRQLMLSAREMSQASLPDRARSWINTHLIYTHGNGVAASRVASSTVQGQPDVVVGNVPPEVVPGMVKSANTRIYYGESGGETPYIVVKSGVKELDYPTEDPTLGKNSYDGKGGVELSSRLRRWAFAWRFRDANLFLSSAVRPDSRILFRRGVRDRIAQVAPFLKLDFDPYIVLTSKGYVWVQDAYTTTNMYPYSERVNLADVTAGKLRGDANYIRNSVKVTVDANDGTVTLYVFDTLDPVIRTWQRVFPTSFKPIESAPAEVREHLRYPEDLLSAQASLYTIYHMTDADDFYSREDAWELPEDPRNTGQIQPPYYVLMRLPGEKSEEFILFTQFTPRQRQNLTAWLAARSDPQGYGQLISFVLPKQKNVVGPKQVLAQINSDPVFSPLRSLLDQGGSNVLFGNLLTIPIENSFLYVQPMYVLGQGSRLPELKKVVVVAGETVKVGDTLEEALALLTGAAPPQTGGGTEPPVEATVAELIAEALRHFNAAQEALKRGDFATYGREQAAMKSALDRAARASGAATPSPSPTASPRG